MPQQANARRKGGTGALMERVRDRVDFRTAARMSVSNAQAQIDLHRELAPRYAYRYSLEFSRLFQEDWHAEMISHVPLGARRVLDLGCGTGFFLAELERKQPGAVGLDISFEMLKVSEKYIPGARLVTADAERLPFLLGSFDVVFCKGSLHHVRNHVKFLANCREALGASGVLVLSEPCNDNPLIRLARSILYRKSPHFDEGDEGFTRKGIVGLCEQAGFEVVKVRCWPTSSPASPTTWACSSTCPATLGSRAPSSASTASCARCPCSRCSASTS